MNLQSKLSGLLFLFCGCSLLAMDQQVSTSSSSTEDTHVQSRLLNKQLIEATKKGDVAEMTALLDKGADIDAQKWTGLTPLAHAAYYGHTACVKLLLERGANWNTPDPILSAYKIALLEEHHECAKLFWERGFCVSKEVFDIGTALGETKLQRAILFCDLNRTGSLIEDADYVKEVNHRHTTAQNLLLGCAALVGSLEIMKLLIDKGADLHGPLVGIDTVLSLASLGGCCDCVLFCLDNGVSVDTSVNRYRPVFWDFRVLCGAIESGSLEVLKLLLDRGASADMHLESNHSLLFVAAATGNYEMMMELIGRGADLGTRKRGEGLTLLHAAAEGGSLQCFKHFLKCGLSLNQKDISGSNLLHHAADSGSLELTKFLLKKNFDVNAQNDNGRTPLHHAALKGNLSVIKELIAHGADVLVKTRMNETLIDFVVLSGSAECLSCCLDLNVPINSGYYDGSMPLYRTIDLDFPECARLLIARGADINKSPPDELPMQLLAAKRGRIDIMLQLIAKGANPFVQTSNGITLLHAAANSGSISGVETCLENGIDVNVQTNDQVEFPLHCAVQSGSLDVVKLLLDSGATIDARTKGGVTPLMAAVQLKQVAIFDELLARGAHCDSKVMSYAVKSLLHFVEACVGRGILVDVDCDTCFLHDAVTEGSIEVVRFLIARDVEVDSRDSSGKTPLMCAAKRGSVEIMKLLIENDASIEAKDFENKKTSLHYAALSGSLECVKLCVESGLDPEDEDMAKWRPIHCAAWSETLDVIRYLVEEKNVSIHCGVFGTPLHLLAKLPYLEGVKYLLSKGAKREVLDGQGWTPLMLNLRRRRRQRNDTAIALLDAGVVTVGLKKILREVVRENVIETHLYGLLVPYCYRLFNPSPAELKDSIEEIDKAFKYFMWIRYGKSKDIDRVGHPTLHRLGLDNQLWILTADPDLSDNLACVLLSELNSDESSVRPKICEWFTPKNRSVVLAADASREAVVIYLLRKLKTALAEVVSELKNEPSQSSGSGDELARISAIVQSDIEDERLRECIRDGINRRFKQVAEKTIVSNDDSGTFSSQITKKQEQDSSDKIG